MGSFFSYRVMHVQHVDISMMDCGHALHVEGWPLLLLQGDGGTDVIKTLLDCVHVLNVG